MISQRWHWYVILIEVQALLYEIASSVVECRIAKCSVNNHQVLVFVRCVRIKLRSGIATKCIPKNLYYCGIDKTVATLCRKEHGRCVNLRGGGGAYHVTNQIAFACCTRNLDA